MVHEENSLFDRFMQSRYRQGDPDVNRVNFDEMDRYFHGQQEHDRRLLRQTFEEMMRSLDKGTKNDLRTSGRLPLGTSATGGIFSLPSERNTILFTGPIGTDPVASRVLVTAAKSAHYLHPITPFSHALPFAVHADIAAQGKAWQPLHKEVMKGPDNASAVRALFAGNEGVYTQGAGYANPRVGMVDTIVRSIQHSGSDIQQGHVVGGYETQRGFVPLVGPRNLVIAQDVRPGDLNSEWGELLAFMMSEFRRTPFARMVGTILHVPVDTLFRAKGRDLNALHEAIAVGQMEPAISDTALPYVADIARTTGTDLSAFDPAAYAMTQTEEPSDTGLHVRESAHSTGRVETVLPE